MWLTWAEGHKGAPEIKKSINLKLPELIPISDQSGLQCPYFDIGETKITNVSNLSCLDHDPEDKCQVDQVKDAEDVLGQSYVCTLAAKRKHVIWSVASLLLDLDWLWSHHCLAVYSLSTWWQSKGWCRPRQNQQDTQVAQCPLAVCWNKCHQPIWHFRISLSDMLK